MSRLRLVSEGGGIIKDQILGQWKAAYDMENENIRQLPQWVRGSQLTLAMSLGYKR